MKGSAVYVTSSEEQGYTVMWWETVLFSTTIQTLSVNLHVSSSCAQHTPSYKLVSSEGQGEQGHAPLLHQPLNLAPQINRVLASHTWLLKSRANISLPNILSCRKMNTAYSGGERRGQA